MAAMLDPIPALPQERDDGQKLWAPFVDLLAGTVAVLILFFLALKVQEQLQRHARAATLEANLTALMTDLDKRTDHNAVEVDVKDHRIRIKDAAFESRSACLSPASQSLIQEIGPGILADMLKDPGLKVLVEGHTDTRPLTQVYITPCGAFNDNYSLSAARANSARRELIDSWPEEVHHRVGIAGYGPDQLLDPAHPEDGCNRRIEIRLELDPPGHPSVP